MSISIELTAIMLGAILLIFVMARSARSFLRGSARTVSGITLVAVMIVVMGLIAGCQSPTTTVTEKPITEKFCDPTPKPSTLRASMSEVLKTKPDCIVSVNLSRAKWPLTTKHVEDAIKEGHPSILTLDRDDDEVVKDRRYASTSPYTCPSGYDRDEYPPALSLEGGKGADIECVPASDNRGAGSSMGNQLSRYEDGTRFRIVVTP